MTSFEIEIAVARYFNPRVNICVPNVSWGLGLHEVDLLILTKNGYAYEVEIKTTKSDLRADLKKHHGHHHYKISRLYFAIPYELQCSADLIPRRAGILIVDNHDSDMPWCQCVRQADVNHNYQFTAAERMALARLGTMRIWTLKEQIHRVTNIVKK